MREKKKKVRITTIITYFILILANFIALNIIISVFLDYAEDCSESLDNYGFQNKKITPKLANNDTTAPILTFINPSINNSIITQYSYDIIVSVSDENPPLSGNVIIQISNWTNFLFNASMNNTGGDLWNFNWVNLSQYTHQEWYILQVWAKDSSLSGNSNWSGAFYVFLNIYPSNGPPILNIILNLVIIIVIFIAIFYYLNKKVLYKSS
ncbi:MAG: hypothetical protein ACFE75_07765 [Candidatus Hodarchaeota archaeon]